VKAFLKICQICSAPLSLRAVSQGVLLTNSLKSWKLVFLKFRVLITLLAFPIFLRSVNSTNACSLQPSLPPVLTSLMSSLALVSIMSSIASSWAGVSITWLKKLSSMHSKCLLNCLHLAALLFQQMSGWLKSPGRTKDCEHAGSWSWRKKASSAGSP